jgi:hypothetical protein
MPDKMILTLGVQLVSAMTSRGSVPIRLLGVVVSAAALSTTCSAPTGSPASSLPQQNIVVVVSRNTVHNEFHQEERIWKIPGTHISRTQESIDGQVVFDTGVGADGTQVTVLHDSGTYRVEPPLPCSDLAKCGSGLPLEPDIFTPDGVQQSIADGSLAVIASNVETDGRPAIHLRGNSNLQISLSGTLDMWVDPSTNLPFRYRVSGSSTERDATVTYIPQTGVNLSQLVVPIPAEFTEVRPIEGREVVNVPSRPAGG